MKTYFILRTHDDPLGAVRGFLGALFERARLDQLLVPLSAPETEQVGPQGVTKPEQLAAAAPFAPLMAVNAATLVAAARGKARSRRIGAVLRPCEVRALTAMAERESFDLGPFFLIGVDCLGTLPLEGGGWGDADDLARHAMQFARQGGVAMYRCRPACQMCVSPLVDPAAVDVSIGLLGLPVRQFVFVGAGEELAASLGLKDLTDGRAEAAYLTQRRAMGDMLLRRRERTRQRMVEALGTDLAMDVDELIAHLTHCQPCRECLDACPVCGGAETLFTPDGVLSREAVVNWLTSCAGCGMCEQACPDHLPLAAIFGRISRELNALAAGMSGGSSAGELLPT